METRRGMTMLEILLGVIILAVLVGAVLPTFAGHAPRAQLQSSGQRLQALIRHAQGHAKRSGKTVRLVLPKSYGSAHVEQAEIDYPVIDDFSAVGADWARGFEFFGRTRARATAFYGEGACTCDEAEHVYFYPDGSADPCEIALYSPDGDTFAVSIARSTGRLKVRQTSKAGL